MFSIPSNDNDKSITSHNGNIDSVFTINKVNDGINETSEVNHNLTL